MGQEMAEAEAVAVRRSHGLPAETDMGAECERMDEGQGQSKHGGESEMEQGDSWIGTEGISGGLHEKKGDAVRGDYGPSGSDDE